MMHTQSYIPLPRKYRPQRLEDLVGQEAIAKALGNAITRNQISHAYLFTGPRGTGKTSSARIVAKSLNCVEGPTTSPCLQCPQCESIAAGHALDVIEFDAASNNSVDNARELIESTQFRPMHGRYKIYIIDEVHMLSNAAFNALLKTLEEPPERVIFIFATTEVHKVLPTIISRCQRFDFQSVDTQTITRHLEKLQQQEGFSLEDEATRMIARMAKGGMRDALSLLDQVSLLAREYAPKPLAYTLVAELLGQLPEHYVVQLAEGILTHAPAKVLLTLQEIMQRGMDAYRIQRALLQHWRAMLLLQFASTGEGFKALSRTLELEASYVEALKHHLTLCSPERLSLLLQQTAHLETQLRHTQDATTWLESALVNFSFEEHFITLKALKARIQALETQLTTGYTPRQAETQPPPQHSPRPEQTHYPPTSKPTELIPVAPTPAPVMPTTLIPSIPHTQGGQAIHPQATAVSSSLGSPPMTVIPAVNPAYLNVPSSGSQAMSQAPSQTTTIPQVASPHASTPPMVIGTVPQHPHEVMAKLSPYLPVTIRPIMTQQVRVIEASQAGLVFECRSAAHYQTLLHPNKQPQIAEAIQKAFGQAVPWRLVQTSASVAHTAPPPVALPFMPTAPQPHDTTTAPENPSIASRMPQNSPLQPSVSLPYASPENKIPEAPPPFHPPTGLVIPSVQMPVIIEHTNTSPETVSTPITARPRVEATAEAAIITEAKAHSPTGIPSPVPTTAETSPSEATHSFQQALTAPPKFVNERQLDASKKMLLDMFKARVLDTTEL